MMMKATISSSRVNDLRVRNMDSLLGRCTIYSQERRVLVNVNPNFTGKITTLGDRKRGIRLSAVEVPMRRSVIGDLDRVTLMPDWEWRARSKLHQGSQSVAQSHQELTQEVAARDGGVTRAEAVAPDLVV